MVEPVITVLNPVGEVEAQERAPASRPADLRGLRLALLDNSKHWADHFLDVAARKLEARFALRDVVVRRKVGPAVPVSLEAQRAFEGCGALLTAFGD